MGFTITQALEQGIAAHRSGDIVTADKYYTAILGVDPKHPDANHNMGVLAVGLGKVIEALPFFKTALETNPSVEQFWLSYLDALIKLDRVEDAREILWQAQNKSFVKSLEKRFGSYLNNINTNQEPPQERLQELIDLRNASRFQTAVEQAEELLREFPKSPLIYNILGAIYSSMNDLEKAEKAYKTAIKLKPDYAEALNNRGAALNKIGRYEDSVESFKKALEIKPDHVEALYGENAHHLAEACFKALARALRSSIEIDPRRGDETPSTKGVLGGSL